jgi:D-glycero-alpha-D-manno-heptose-7-phosphate kinase
MIISRSPYRISFFGGGTDYNTWYQKYGGSFLSTSIDKYCYVVLKKINKSFKHKYSKTFQELIDDEDVYIGENSIIKRVYKTYNVTEEILPISYKGDLPIMSGIGSSSAFLCAIINAISALYSIDITKEDLAKNAIHVEQKILREYVGVQDQICSSYGGLNKVTINQDGSFAVDNVNVSSENLRNIQQHCLLFFTGIQRRSSDIAKERILTNYKTKCIEMQRTMEIVDEGEKIITSQNIDYKDFGKLLNESWLLKRGLTSRITNDTIDHIYDVGLKNGATGGKLLGAGGGGFFLLFADPVYHKQIREALNKFSVVDFKFENSGSSILYNGYKSFL